MPTAYGAVGLNNKYMELIMRVKAEVSVNGKTKDFFYGCSVHGR